MANDKGHVVDERDKKPDLVGIGLLSEQDWLDFGSGHGGACVQVKQVDIGVVLRDSKNPSLMLAFSANEWAEFTRGVKAGAFDGTIVLVA